MKGWEIKKLNEICENLDKQRIPITKSVRQPGNIPYYGASGIVDYVADYIFNEDLLLVSEDGANLLARTYPIAFSITGKTWVNNHAHVLRFAYKPTQKFVEYYLNFISIEAYVSGMAQPKLNQKSLNSIDIPLPPIPEQKRIVAILDEAFEGIDAAIANTEKNLANARELFESYLNGVFSQKGEGWVEKKLGDICIKITDGKHGDCVNEENSGYYFLSAKDVKDDRLNYANAREITQEDFEETHRRTNLEPLDILVTNSGTIGRTAIAKEDPRTYRTTFQKSVAILKPQKSEIDSFFCRYGLMANLSSFIKVSSGTAQKNLLLRDIRAYKFSMPQSIDAQREISQQLTILLQETQRLESIYQRKLEALQELKQSILQKAFTGELTSDTVKEAADTSKEAAA